MFVIIVTQLLCFITSVYTLHNNICPVRERRTQFYHDYDYLVVPCDPIDYWFIPSCEAYNAKRIYQLTTRSRSVYVTTDYECCPGYIQQGDQCIQRENQGCGVDEYRTMGQCEECDCVWSNAYTGCAQDTGFCFCKPGYIGPKCEIECPDNWFGLDCRFECVCKNNSVCNKTDGQCPCSMPGWTGMTCSEACPTNKYGMFCAETCDCPDRFCDPEEGCICNPGYTGESCEEVCPPSSLTYGPDCREPCMCQPQGSEGCDPVNGTCFCKPGWEGRFCNDLCSNETYGSSCNETCQCEEYQKCLPTTGQCVCPLGFSGESCNTSINSTSTIPSERGDYRMPLGGILALVVLTLILVIVAIVIVILARRNLKKRNLERKKSRKVERVERDGNHYSTVDEEDGNVHVNDQHNSGNVHVDDHYNSFYDQQPLQKSTETSHQAYDQMKVISGMYDSFHGNQATMVISDDYDNVKMTNPNASTQYDSMIPSTRQRITEVIGSEYDRCELVQTDNT
ncbi:platelet endothelial aggregation receptor 1-like [Argopecten irradians]|uniref:platelet endothelial aggregation receptor 1-like n=1 Tax=Argopecten irradians TaxID=31199 RepID=UPI00371E76BA